MRLTKKTYLLGFISVVLLLACIRWAFPQVAAARSVEGGVRSENTLAQPEIVNRTREALGSSKKSVNRKYNDRPIDIDILLYDELMVDEPDLKIPHPLMHERDFVMIPLNEIK